MYIPILKNRMYENKFIKEYPELFDDEKIIPLIEIITLKIGRKEMDIRGMLDYYNNVLNSTFFIDFFTFNEKEYKPFDANKVIFSIALQSERIYNYFELLNEVAQFKNAIPVISINSGREFILSDKYINDIIDKLQKSCSRIAVRVQSKYFEDYFQIFEDKLRETDFLMYDLSELNIDAVYFDLINIETKKGQYKTIIINSPRKRTFHNDRYLDGGFTGLIDNTIRNTYQENNFDGFGDYAGLKDILPTGGGNGKGAALGLFYMNENNKFFSIMNKNKELGASGHEYIIDKALGHYNDLLDSDENCPALKYIKEELRDKGKSGTWGLWKYITILRYISQIKMSTNN